MVTFKIKWGHGNERFLFIVLISRPPPLALSSFALLDLTQAYNGSVRISTLSSILPFRLQLKSYTLYIHLFYLLIPCSFISQNPNVSSSRIYYQFFFFNTLSSFILNPCLKFTNSLFLFLHIELHAASRLNLILTQEPSLNFDTLLLF